MALIYHRASLVPSKGELVSDWLPARPWAPGGPIVAGLSYRLDDPAGEVGMEGFLLTAADGVTVHVPLTYRAQPLAGAEEHLLGTMEHSVLGTRWTYDGCGDPVFVATLIATIATGGTEAAEELEADGQESARREPQVRVRGSGAPGSVVGPIGAMQVSEDADTTSISCDAGELVVVRRVGATPSCSATLTAAYGDAVDVLLAGLR